MKKRKIENTQLTEDVYKDLIKYKTRLSYSWFYITLIGFYFFLDFIGKNNFELNYKLFIWFIPAYYISMLFMYGYSIKEMTVNFLSLITIYNFALEFNPLNMIKISSDYYISNVLYFHISFLIVTFNFKIYERLSNFIDIIFGQLTYLRAYPCIAYPALAFTLIMYTLVVILIFKLANFPEIIIPIFALLFWLTMFILFISMITDIRRDKKSSKLLSYLEKKEKTTKYEDKINKAVTSFLDIINIKRLGDQNDHTKSKKEKLKESKTKILLHTVLIKITKLYPLLMLIILTNNYAYYGMYLEKNEKYCKEVNQEIYKNSLIVKLKDGDVLRMDKDIENKYSFILNQISCEKQKNLIKVSEGGEKGKRYYKL